MYPLPHTKNRSCVWPIMGAGDSPARHVAAVPRTTGPRDQWVTLVTIGSACVPNQDAGHGLVAVPG